MLNSIFNIWDERREVFDEEGSDEMVFVEVEGVGNVSTAT